MPDYLVRLVQVHESFRKAELLAVAEIAGVEIEIVEYDDAVSDIILHFNPVTQLRTLRLTYLVTVLHNSCTIRYRRSQSYFPMHSIPRYP